MTVIEKTNSSNKIAVGSLKIEKVLLNFVNTKALPGTGISQEIFWQGCEKLISKHSKINYELLNIREKLQEKISKWYSANSDDIIFSPEKTEQFLRNIGYIIPEPESFYVGTKNLDCEINKISGPQLVVPIMNARYVLNAANARWGSLYDAIYGSNIVKSGINTNNFANSYDPIKGENVVIFVAKILDEIFPLETGSHSSVTEYIISGKNLLAIIDEDGNNKVETKLNKPSQFLGYQNSKNTKDVSTIVLQNNGLHLLIKINRFNEIGKLHKAGVSDIILESALSVIMDCEDSVAGVDAEDKVLSYSNWLGLMKTDLTCKVHHKNKSFTRKLNEDFYYHSVEGKEVKCKACALMLCRNVGHFMTSDAIIDKNGNDIPEGLMDILITSLIGIHDIKNKHNSKSGSIYIVKPKMHGPDEVRFMNDICKTVEEILSLPVNTIKLGLMDEERRTTVNLLNCIKEIKDRIFFINTGFLDRTGDEIHTIMNAGRVIEKQKIKKSIWINAYERWNVDIGLKCKLNEIGQIGKGMWAMPELMAEMLLTKGEQLEDGASTSWVPSPTAATIHAIHYHRINVIKAQKKLKSRQFASIQELLTIPIAKNKLKLSISEVNNELENNIQSILGYVVKWINQGIGCSKVLDRNNIALMEDRATLRISSQHVANWLLHNICTEEQVNNVFTKMAKVVDKQNEDDTDYVPLLLNSSSNKESSIAFTAARSLVFEGISQPSGYTEAILHKYRRQVKQKL